MAKVVFTRRKTFPLKSQQVWIPATNYVLSGEGCQLAKMVHQQVILYVVIHVKEHHIFERDGNNLYCEVPTVSQWLR